MKRLEDLNPVVRQEVERIMGLVCDCNLDRNIARNCPAAFITGIIAACKSSNLDATFLEQLLELIDDGGD